MEWEKSLVSRREKQTGSARLCKRSTIISAAILSASSFASAATFTWSGAGVLTLSGALVDSSNGNHKLNLTKTNSGTLILTSTNSTYTGATAINAGTLQVDGLLSGSGALSMASGTTLSGTGRLNKSTTL